MQQGLTFGCVGVLMLLAGCTTPAGEGGAPATAPTATASKNAVGRSQDSPSDAATFSKPLAAMCDKPTSLDVAKVSPTRLDANPGSLAPGTASRVPWTEYDGNPEQGRVQALHVGERTLSIRAEGSLREVTVWRSGVVWFQDNGLRFVGFHDGRVRRIKHVPAWYDLLTYAKDRIFFTRGTVVQSISANALDPRKVVDAAEIIDLPANARKARVRAVGALGRDDPVWQLTYREGTNGRRVRSAYHSVKHGQLPIDSHWAVKAGSNRILASDPDGRKLAAFGPDGRELWCHTFRRAGRQLGVNLPLHQLTPGGRHVIAEFKDHELLVLNARTGAPLHRLLLPRSYVRPEIEDDAHIIWTAYDGPPNPNSDPSDPEPAPSELDWDNVLVRCSFQGDCERAARVDAPQQSLVTGTTHLFKP